MIPTCGWIGPHKNITRIKSQVLKAVPKDPAKWARYEKCRGSAKTDLTMPCLFCALSTNAANFLYENTHWYVIPDKFPASPGHSLIILKTHEDSAFELDGTQWAALQDALTKTKEKLDQSHNPDAYNVGINDGKAAGRMIDHVHVHLIPRYASAPAKGGIEALLKGGKKE